MADRFYTSEPLTLGEFVLSGPEAHHLAHVSRIGEGEVVALFNGDGLEYTASVLSVGKKQVVLQVIAVESPRRERAFRLHIASALPKGDRGDFLVEKLTELGVTDFTPLITERGVVIPKETKVEKFERAVIEASKQCGRNVLMRIHPPRKLADWLKVETLPRCRLLAHPGGRRLAVGDEDVAIAIGPEGGFTDGEVAAATQNGFEIISLGPRILRIETAAIVAACMSS